jgi:MauM/NapG family ferredoxin protein
LNILKRIDRRQLRRACQILCLSGFVWLFVQTEYRDVDQLPYPVSLLFRIDPLAAIADALAPGPFSWGLLWPSLLLICLTVLFGRFFCGWICPLGTTLDGLGKAVGRGCGPVRPSFRRFKYLLLMGLVTSAFFGVQQIGLFDPLSIFLRTLTFSIYPVWNLLLNSLFDVAYPAELPLINETMYPFLRDNLMAFYQPVFNLGLFTLLIFLGIVLLEKIERRFWCKNICPLGGLLGICSGHSLIERRPAAICSDCSRCATECRSGVVDGDYRKQECFLCFDCEGFCPHERVRFRLLSAPASTPIDLTRRHLVGAVACGALIAPTMQISPAQAKVNPYLIRPPGAVAEEEFLRRCIRCGECMKVCIGAALHPALAEAGVSGLWTPLLVARLGYCEYNCTLCGQVCPTGAIRELQVEPKRKEVIGLAVIDKNTCLPFARGEECLVCEEHCPTGKKAIIFEEHQVLVDGEMKTLKFPQVVEKLCIGCGICETKCPLYGRSAIRVVNEGESRHKGDELISGGYGG